jgi:hypothetical protein
VPGLGGGKTRAGSRSGRSQTDYGAPRGMAEKETAVGISPLCCIEVPGSCLLQTCGVRDDMGWEPVTVTVTGSHDLDSLPPFPSSRVSVCATIPQPSTWAGPICKLMLLSFLKAA